MPDRGQKGIRRRSHRQVTAQIEKLEVLQGSVPMLDMQ